jgi:hypothetical protein
MTQVVQATCPGCKAVLRIPADWVAQPIKCKNCGTIMQAKQPAQAAPPAPPPIPQKTPTPAPRRRGKPAASPKADATPPPVPRPDAVRPAVSPPPVPPPMPAPAPTATTAVPPAPKQTATRTAPVAPSVAAPSAAPVSKAAFSFEAVEEAPTRRTTSRRSRKGGPWWKGPLILGCVLLLAGGVAVAMWPRLQAALTQANAFIEKQGDLAEGPGPDPAPKKETPSAGPSKPTVKSAPMGTPTKGNDPDSKPKGPGPREKGGPRPKNPSPPPVLEENPKPIAESKDPFPRRTLFITVHNYLYANPIQNPRAAIQGTQKALDRVIEAINSNLNVPLSQRTHLSDMAKTQPIPPMKSVIEKTLTDFLEQSRKQDRIMVFFVGHSVELGEVPYLVPIEGELDNAATLIPLAWVFEQMAKCPARQKILVLDAHRFNPGQGVERPNSGVMGPKFEAMVKAPPEGVQVWAACGAGEMSYETDARPGGVFLDSLKSAFFRSKSGEKSVLDGRIQKPADLIPIETLHEGVNKRIAAYLGSGTMKQVAQLTGKDRDNGAMVDTKEALPPQLALAAPKLANAEVVRAVVDEISVPPLKVGQSDAIVSFNALPPFAPDAMKKYEDEGPADSPVRKAVRNARAHLWALTGGSPPDLIAEVDKAKAKMGPNGLNILQDRFTAPAAGPAENAFKRKLENNLKEVSKLITPLEEALDELKEVEPLVKDAPKRWQAHFTFVYARVQEQLTILEEYEGALGQMRKEFPPRKEGDIGWRLAAKAKSTDGTAKKYEKKARQLLADLAKEHAGTPWEVLAKREKLTSLALEWKSTDGSDN